jgi:hypothetical protein
LHSRDCSSLETETFPPSIFPLWNSNQTQTPLGIPLW